MSGKVENIINCNFVRLCAKIDHKLCFDYWLLHSIMRLAVPNVISTLHFLLLMICQLFVIILAGRASVIAVVLVVSSTTSSARSSLLRLVRLYLWAQSTSSRWCQSGYVAVWVAEVLRIELSLELDVGVFRLRTYSILAANFILETCQILMHRHRVLSLEVDPRDWTSVPLRLRHSQAAHIWDKIALVLG